MEKIALFQYIQKSLKVILSFISLCRVILNVNFKPYA